MPEVVLAIDAGSTGVRAIAFDRSGRALGRAYRENALSYPRPGWVEQDAAVLWESVLAVAAEAAQAAGAEPRDLVALGVTGQRSTAVAWDGRTGEPLHPAIGWQDLRASERAAEVGAQGFFVPAQAAALKLEWMVRNVAAVRSEGARLGTLESYLVWRLSGGAAHVTDASFASASALYDFFGGSWNAPLVETLGLPAERLPEIRSSSERYAVTEETLLGARVPIAGLAGDQQAAMFGQLRRDPGGIKASYGTSTMVDLNVGESMTFSSHGAWPMVLWKLGGTTTYLLEGSLITGGAAIRWLRDRLGLLADVTESGVIAASVPDSGGVWAIPALQGIGTPYQDPEARAAIGGMSLSTTSAHVVRAILEGLAFRVAEIVGALEADSPHGRIETLRVDGGAAANDFLLQFQADVLGVPVERPETVEAAATGVAFLAGLATGFWPDVSSLDDAWRLGARFEPRMSEDERASRRERFAARLEAVRRIR